MKDEAEMTACVEVQQPDLEQIYTLQLSQDQDTDDPFSDYMWMEHEEEFDRQVEEQLREEDFIERCFEEMLEEEERFEAPWDLSSPAVCPEHNLICSSTLNPDAPEFVPAVTLQSL